MIRSMEVECLPYRKTGYFSKIITDYLDESENLHPYYNRFPGLDAFKDQIKEKQNNFSPEKRRILSDALKKQCQGLALSDKTAANIDLLKSKDTFTVVTGHQLNLFTGPLYFLYKIISTINLCEELAKKYPKYNFIPVYWMATEDHDFEEINYFNFRGQKIRWNKESGGAVGRLNTAGLDEVYTAFEKSVGKSRQAIELLELFKKSYLEHEVLTEATRFLANELFGPYGLVVVDGDDASLKSLLAPYVEKDLFENTTYQAVTDTINKWQESGLEYNVQVNPREINYFYLLDGLRERIVREEGIFKVNNSDITFTKEEVIAELKDHPERFSPNVITRPLYQEVILPNLCYIGGGGEIAYWLELQSSFKTVEVPFPILLLRNSALIISEKQYRKLNKLNLSLEDVFMKQNSFINKKIREISNINIDMSSQKKHLTQQFEGLYELAEMTDKSFLGAVKAQEVKQLRGIENLEKRLLKAQKRKLEDHVVRMCDLQNELFPNQSLQERSLNFSEPYNEYGKELITRLMESLRPLKMEFSIIKY